MLELLKIKVEKKNEENTPLLDMKLNISKWVQTWASKSIQTWARKSMAANGEYRSKYIWTPAIWKKGVAEVSR